MAVKVSRENLVEYVVKIVNNRLLEFFEELDEEVLREAPKARDLVTASKDYTLRGGKRLRAVLALIGYWSKEWGGGDVNAITDVMAAIELLQSYLLIHDDVMDKDELRRGGPTVHVMFQRKCIENNWRNCEHYGVSQAIVAGDMVEASAIGLLASGRLKPEVIRELVSAYSKGLRKVAYGQYLDVMYSQLSIREVSEEDIMLIYKFKTSSYTVELPLHLGSIASSRHNNRLLSELSSYAMPAGIAFQIRDDIIGLYGDPGITGKPAGSDVKSKKKTLLIAKAYELAKHEDKKTLELVYDNLSEAEITNEHVEEVRRIVKESGALDYAEESINNHVQSALSALENSVEICDEAKDVLKRITYKLAYREK
ncbi:MAG: polyprenyl synthetase family protein [Desulfurococcaceae archaeon]